MTTVATQHLTTIVMLTISLLQRQDSDPAVKLFRIVPHRHDECKQFLLGLVRRGEVLDQDAARGQTNPLGQIFKFLVDDGVGRFDQNPRLLASLCMPRLNQPRKAFTPLAFVCGGIAFRQLSQIGEDIFLQSEAVLADGTPDERLQNLLSAPAADAENRFEQGAVDPGGGKGGEFGFGFVKPVIPGRFVRCDFAELLRKLQNA